MAMKKFLLTLTALTVMMTAVEAKVIKITLTDGSQQVYTSSELSAIDINDDGTLTVTTWDGNVLPPLKGTFEVIEVDDKTAVCTQYNDTLNFQIDADGIPVDLHSDRPITKINYVYPSKDPFGEPVTLSGTILIPDEVWAGQKKCEGILMMNHYTKFHRDEAPTVSNGELENMMLANPFRPNYIIVESDFYGFGATVRFPQAFAQGPHNARASLDGLIAARELLDQMGFDYGPLCFNLGYSSGGYDALFAQKVRDMEYADRISFDKTFAGGGPYMVSEAYRQYVLADTTAYNAVPLLLMVSTKETQGLDLQYADVFQPYICNRIDELINSKNYSSWPVCDSIGREKKVHEILTAPYCNLESEESRAMQEVLRTFDLTNDDWTPDLSQRIYIFHSRDDDYVPVQCARPIVSFLASKGFEPSIVPGKTNLQTNFLVKKMGHLSGTLVYYIQTLAAVKAWPAMYTNNRLNPLYAAIVKCKLPNIVRVMRRLDAIGLNCRGLLNCIAQKIVQDGEGSEEAIQAVQAALAEALSKLGVNTNELDEMLYDSGYDIQGFITELIEYMKEGADANDGDAAARSLVDGQGVEQTPAEEYELQMNDWLRQANLIP